MSAPSAAEVEAVLADLAAAGLVEADARWVHYGVERRRVHRRLLPGAVRRRLPPALLRTRARREAVEARLRQRAEGGWHSPVRIGLGPPPAAIPPDDALGALGAAGLPRTLLVPDEPLAGLLRAHDLHLDAGAPVLAVPREPLPDWLLAGIERAGDGARVLVLHDCSAASLATLPGLGERLALPERARLVPVGLWPAHARRLSLPVLRSERPGPELMSRVAACRLGRRDLEWLSAGNAVEAAAVPPARLLRALRRLLLGAAAAPRRAWLPSRRPGFV